MKIEEQYREIWPVDFEFRQPPGELPEVHCMVAHETKSGATIRLWADELRRLKAPPYNIGPDSLVLGYYASAEMNCHLALGWELPVNVIDLYGEFRVQVNGIPYPFEGKVRYNLLTALRWCGLDAMSLLEKEAFRDLSMRGGPFSEQEKRDLLDYCASDTFALPGLLEKLDSGLFGHPGIDVHAAVIRGDYVKAVSRMEHRGIPIDTQSWDILQDFWPRVMQHLVNEVDSHYHVFEGTTFKESRFEDYLREHDIPWEWYPSGRARMDKDFFSDMCDVYPMLRPLYDLRIALSQMRDNKLAVGADRRNRTMLGQFGTVTGRNAYKAGEYIFGQAAWLRALIRAKLGMGVAYIDWGQQEYAVSAILSGDPLMIEAYESGDPYLAFARQCNAVPEGATKDSHFDIRTLYKQCVLGTLYGMGAKTLALRTNRSEIEARWLLQQHRRTYKRFWQWARGVIDYASLYGKLWTSYGWETRIVDEIRPTSVQNWPVQATAADMLRLACIICDEKGIRTIGTLHDAILVEFDIEDADSVIQATQAAMAEASRLVLEGFELRSDVKKVVYPGRYVDERGIRMWNQVWRIIGKVREESRKRPAS